MQNGAATFLRKPLRNLLVPAFPAAPGEHLRPHLRGRLCTCFHRDTHVNEAEIRSGSTRCPFCPRSRTAPPSRRVAGHARLPNPLPGCVLTTHSDGDAKCASPRSPRRHEANARHAHPWCHITAQHASQLNDPCLPERGGKHMVRKPASNKSSPPRPCLHAASKRKTSK